MEKEVLRKCIACSEFKNRENLIKITREHDSRAIFINPNTKIFGRSAYLCYNDSCIETAFKKNRLQKVLRTTLDADFKKVLTDALGEKNYS